MKEKKNIDLGVVLAILAIIIIAGGLVFATIIKYNYDNDVDIDMPQEEDPNLEEDDDNQNEDIILFKKQASTYILALESSFQQNAINDPTYQIPSNQYLTEVIFNIGVDVYPDTINLFVENGKIISGNITIGNYTFTYNNGILS